MKTLSDHNLLIVCCYELGKGITEWKGTGWFIWVRWGSDHNRLLADVYESVGVPTKEENEIFFSFNFSDVFWKEKYLHLKKRYFLQKKKKNPNQQSNKLFAYCVFFSLKNFFIVA